MTSLNTPIVFNASTGSDSQMSGSPSTRLIPSTLTLQITSGSNVAYGAASGAVNVGDLVYAPSQTSGRKFNVVAAINTSTFPNEYTFDDNWDASDFNATCYSGGKRATFDNADSRKVFQEIGPQFKGSIQTETDQTITSPITPVSLNSGMGGIVESAGDMKTITLTTNDSHFEGGGSHLIVKNLKFANSASGTKNAPIFQWNNTWGRLPVTAFSCVFGDQTNPCYELYFGGGSYRSSINMYRCTIQYMTSSIAFRNNQNRQVVQNCLFQNNSSVACGFSGSSGGLTADIRGCIFANQPTGFSNGRAGSTALVNNIFYNCSSNAIYYSIDPPVAVVGNLFVNCGTAINNANSTISNAGIENNYFYNNTTKYVNQNFAASAIADVDLSADPFVDAPNGDWNISASSGGGATLRATNYTLEG